MSADNPMILEGLDFEARPVMVISAGALDCAALKKKGITLAMLVRRHVKAMEELQAHIDASPNPYAGHLMILDIGGCTVGKFIGAWRFWREIARVGEAFYPELAGKMAVVRGPSLAGWAIDKVKQFLDEKTLNPWTP